MKNIYKLTSLFLMGVFFISFTIKAEAASILISDSFGSASTSDVPGWVDGGGDSDNDSYVTNGTARAGSPTTYQARLRDGGYITKTISTLGYQNIVLKYYWRGDNDGDGNSDNLKVYWKKTSDVNYTLLNTHQLDGNEVWSNEIAITLPSSANNTSIDLKFLGDSNSDTEEARVDDVSLVGEIMTDLCSNIEGIQTTIPENYHATENNNCVPNEIVPDPVCDSKLNLINNSSFEDPVITKVDLWDTFTNVPGWKIAWVGNHEEIPSLELQKGWLASDGVQYAELDGDLVGPSHPTAGASTQISQSINTIVGKNYKLKFNFSGRPNTNETQNILGVTWGGENVAGTPLVLSNLTNQTDWKNYTYDLMATTSITEIAFKDQGVEDSLGTFIDNITLTCEEPGTPVEPTTSKIFFKKYIVGSGVANYQGEGAPSFKLNIMGAGNGDLLLNAANSYSEDSEPVINGNNSVTIYENTSAKDESSNVLPYETSCIPGKYKFAGYGVGNSFVQAAESATTTTDLVLANINQDKYVVVWNELCPNVEQPPVVCENGFHLVENQCVPNQVTPTNVVNSDGGSSNNTSGGRHHESSGGGSGGSNGNQGQVLGASTENLSCEPYLKEYIKFGAKNNPEEVKKLQTFLNQFFEINIPITGFYGTTTFDWVKKFQAHQEAGTLKPWEVAGLSTDGPTGYVYKTTKRWINILKCPEMVATLPIPNLP